MITQILCVLIIIFVSFLYSYKESFTTTNLYFNEVSMEDVQKIINKVPLINVPNIDRYEPVMIKQMPQEIINKSNIYLESIISNNFKVVESRLVNVKEYDDKKLCNIIFIIHRENRYIGFELEAVILIDNGVIQGISTIKIINSVSEDQLYLKSGYDNNTHYEDAYSIEHTIMKPKGYEENILKAQQDGLYQDRGLTKNILN